MLSLREHVGLQLWKVALLVAALSDPHVQQVGVYGCVVSFQQSALDGLGCTDTHTAWLTSYSSVDKVIRDSGDKDEYRENWRTSCIQVGSVHQGLLSCLHTDRGEWNIHHWMTRN